MPFTQHDRDQMPAASVAELVSATWGYVAYVDRDGVLADLQEWLGSAESLAVAIVGGRGGSGKTRLAAELIATLPAGWVGGFLPSSAGSDRIADLARCGTPLVVVLDYAEFRSGQVDDALLALRHLASPVTPVRVLLLVRQPAAVRPGRDTGEAWRDAVTLPVTSPALPLLRTAHIWAIDTAVEPLDRLEVFQRAYEAFARALNRPSLNDAPKLHAGLFDLPLNIVIAAYLSAAGTGDLPSTEAGLYDALVEHEARLWAKQWEVMKLDLLEEDGRALVALAGLIDPLPSEGVPILGLLGADREAIGRDKGRIDQWLSRRTPCEPGEHWPPLQPDRISEHLIATAFGTRISELLDWAFDADRDPARMVRTVRALTLACASAATLRHQVLRWLRDGFHVLVDRAVAQANDSESHRAGAVALPSTVATLVESLAADLPLEVLESTQQLPPGHLYLMPLALVLGEATVEQYRALAEANPAAYTPDLAMALNNYANRLAEIGRREEALAPAEEARDLYRALAEANPAAYTPAVASVLNNYANLLAEIGRREEAERVMAEVEELRASPPSNDS